MAWLKCSMNISEDRSVLRRMTSYSADLSRMAVPAIRTKFDWESCIQPWIGVPSRELLEEAGFMLLGGLLASIFASTRVWSWLQFNWVTNK